MVFDHDGGAASFPGVSAELMRAVDQADSARHSLEEVLDPQDWTLLNYLMDARTPLGRFRDFAISTYELMMTLVPACRTLGIEEILALPDVVERVALYRAQAALHAEQLRRCTRIAGEVAVLAVGTSILDRSNPVSVGELVLAHGGGGHRDAGTCQVAHEQSEATLAQLVGALNAGSVETVEPVPA